MSPLTLGTLLSLITAFFWAISPLCFASAGRRIGSLPVSLLRILIATLAFVTIITPLYILIRGTAPPIPTTAQLSWLLLSGLTGMVLGDVLTYQSLIMIGPRRTTQLYMLGPIAAVLLAWIFLGEQLPPRTLLGIAIILTATSYAVLSNPVTTERSTEPGQISAKGIAFGASGAILNGIGAVAARKAYNVGPPLDPVLATAARLTMSALILWIIPLVRGRVRHTLSHLENPHTRSRIALGTIFGPIAAVFCYVAALKYASAGLVTTLSATSPLFILPMVALRYRARIGWTIPLATATAIAGVALICWR